MSDLHFSLLIIGLIFIAAVFLFNQWQERKYRRETERIFRGERQDALLDEPPRKTGEARIEPSFVNPWPAADEPPTPPVSSPPRNVPSINPPPGSPVSASPPFVSQKTAHLHKPPGAAASFSTRPTHPAASYPPAPVEQPRYYGIIDETIDFIGSLRPAQRVSGESATAMMARGQAFSKAVHWEGWHAGQWKEISLDGEYSELKIALQLADRRGAATNDDITRFIALIKQFAVELSASAQLEAEDGAAARATELDAFCADVDVEIGVNLVAGDQAMQATKLRALAESSGLKLTADGVFHCTDEHGALLFTLRNSEPRPFSPDHVRNITTRGITLLLDVPRVAQGVQVFDRMLKLGRHIAQALGGEVVDDNRKPLTDAGADLIRRQLALIYRQMDGYGIPAGSALALRLFS